MNWINWLMIKKLDVVIKNLNQTLKLNILGSQQCKLLCVSQETGDTLVDHLIDGTFCSYDNPHDRCFKGSCKVRITFSVTI